MTWTAAAIPKEELTADFLLELTKKHRLVPENAEIAVANFRSMCKDCRALRILDKESGDEVATVIISGIVKGETAQVDVVPVPRFFKPSDPFREKFSAVMEPVFDHLLRTKNLRRITAMVPKSRSRTAKALLACGFKKEGVMRDAVQFRNKEPEGLVVMGKLPTRELDHGTV